MLICYKINKNKGAERLLLPYLKFKKTKTKRAHDFWWNIFVTLRSVNWPNVIALLPLFLYFLIYWFYICTVIIYFLVYDTMHLSVSVCLSLSRSIDRKYINQKIKTEIKKADEEELKQFVW